VLGGRKRSYDSFPVPERISSVIAHFWIQISSIIAHFQVWISAR